MRVLIGLLVLLASLSCKQKATDKTLKNVPEVALKANKPTIRFQLNNTDLHFLDIGSFGDEEGVRILEHPEQYIQSAITRDQSTNWEPKYAFKAKEAFTGKLLVALERCTLPKGNALACVKDTFLLQLTVVN